MRSFTIEKAQAGQRFDKYLKRMMPQAPTSLLFKSLRKKNITLNGKKAEGKELLKEGDQVCIFFQDETFEKFSGQNVSQDLSLYLKGYVLYQKQIRIVYEDEDVLILDKPSGLLTQKANPQDISVNEWLIGYLLEQKKLTEASLKIFKPSACNRLDRNTSGLVLCGKTLQGSQALSEVLKNRTLHKYYMTYVKGELTNVVRQKAFLIKDEQHNKVMVYDKNKINDTKYAEDNLTEIETSLQPIGYDKASDITKLKVWLITGKSHQIRAHVAHLGFPIVGDYKYGYREDGTSLIVSHHFQMLHAYQVVFPEEFALDLLKGKTITTSLPDTFLQLEKQLCLHGIPED